MLKRIMSFAASTIKPAQKLKNAHPDDAPNYGQKMQMHHRNAEIDFTKGLLTIGMIFAHIIQFFGASDSIIQFRFSMLTNLVTFSGFLFCFGFAFWTAYLSRPIFPWKSVLKTAFKCYLAFVVSGIAFNALYWKMPVSWSMVIKIISAKDIPGYSEFLLTFAVMTIAGGILAPLIRIGTETKTKLLLAVLICISFIYIFPRPNGPRLALLEGGGFPLFPYAICFLIGAYAARHKYKVGLKVFLMAIVTSVTYTALIIKGVNIERFPPTALWIIFSMALVIVYFQAGCAIHHIPSKWIRAYISSVGQNVLPYLLISNLAIFTLKGAGIISTLSYMNLLIPYVSIMAFIYFVQHISVNHVARQAPSS